MAARIRAAGGNAEVIPWGSRPLVIGEVPASANPGEAPTIFCYGHFDVQPPDPLELWESPPFELVERDGWLYARGVADDKGQLYMLLKAAELLAAAGDLPVNLRFACDGEEEIGGHAIVDWIVQDERGADAAVVFDGGMVEKGVPAFDIAVRGLCYFHVKVRVGERDLHSGMYGGASLNAMHALMQILAAVLPHNGRLPEPLRDGIVSPSAEELSAWSALPAGSDEIAAAGSRPADAAAADEFYVRIWAEPAVDVHGIAGGSPMLQKTVIPVEAEANVSIRLVAGQDPVVTCARSSSCCATRRRKAPRSRSRCCRPLRRVSSPPTLPPCSSRSTRLKTCWGYGRCSCARVERFPSSQRSPPVESPPS